MYSKCEWCRKTPRPESERFYPKGWDSFGWDDRVGAMCPKCIKAVSTLLRRLRARAKT